MNSPIPQAVTDEITVLCRRLRLRYIREQSPDVLLTAKPNAGTQPKHSGSSSKQKPKDGTGPPSSTTAKPPGSQPGKRSTPGRPNGPRFRSQPRTPSKAWNGLTATRTS